VLCLSSFLFRVLVGQVLVLVLVLVALILVLVLVLVGPVLVLVLVLAGLVLVFVLVLVALILVLVLVLVGPVLVLVLVLAVLVLVFVLVALILVLVLVLVGPVLADITATNQQKMFDNSQQNLQRTNQDWHIGLYSQTYRLFCKVVTRNKCTELSKFSEEYLPLLILRSKGIN